MLTLRDLLGRYPIQEGILRHLSCLDSAFLLHAMDIKPTDAVRERYLERLIRDLPEHEALVREWMKKGFQVEAVGTDLALWEEMTKYPGGGREYPEEPMTIWLVFFCAQANSRSYYNDKSYSLLPNGEYVVPKNEAEDPYNEAIYHSPTDHSLQFNARDLSSASLFFNPTTTNGDPGADGWRASPIPNTRGFNVLFYQNFASSFQSAAELTTGTSAGSDTELRWALLPYIDRPPVNIACHDFARNCTYTSLSREGELKWSSDAQLPLSYSLVGAKSRDGRRICWFFHSDWSDEGEMLWQDRCPERDDLV